MNDTTTAVAPAPVTFSALAWERALMLAIAYGHWWATALTTPTHGTMGLKRKRAAVEAGARDKSLDREGLGRLYDAFNAEQKAAGKARPWFRLGATIQTVAQAAVAARPDDEDRSILPAEKDGFLTHTTLTGRLHWTIDPVGNVQIDVRRPGAVTCLSAFLSRAGGLRVKVYGNAMYRHGDALLDALKALGVEELAMENEWLRAVNEIRGGYAASRSEHSEELAQVHAAYVAAMEALRVPSDTEGASWVHSFGFDGWVMPAGYELVVAEHEATMELTRARVMVSEAQLSAVVATFDAQIEARARVVAERDARIRGEQPPANLSPMEKVKLQMARASKAFEERKKIRAAHRLTQAKK